MPKTAITIPKIGNISHQKSRNSSSVISHPPGAGAAHLTFYRRSVGFWMQRSVCLCQLHVQPQLAGAPCHHSVERQKAEAQAVRDCNIESVRRPQRQVEAAQVSFTSENVD